MAKKTNKTDRVLNLLSNDQPETELAQETTTANKVIISDSSNVSVINQKEINEESENEIEATLQKELEDNTIKTLEEKKKEDEDFKETIIEKVIAPISDAPKEKNPEIEDSHALVSVMEYIVKLKLEEYMEDFSICGCKRCKADVIALTLTNLPSKFVVTDADNISPLLNFYENKYLGQVAVELTKACMRVSEVPHHRD